MFVSVIHVVLATQENCIPRNTIMELEIFKILMGDFFRLTDLNQSTGLGQSTDWSWSLSIVDPLSRSGGRDEQQ